jgi:hypothetical protein
MLCPGWSIHLAQHPVNQVNPLLGSQPLNPVVKLEHSFSHRFRQEVSHHPLARNPFPIPLHRLGKGALNKPGQAALVGRSPIRVVRSAFRRRHPLISFVKQTFSVKKLKRKRRSHVAPAVSRFCQVCCFYFISTSPQNQLLDHTSF